MSDCCDLMDCSHQAPLSMGFSRQEYWSGLPFPSPGDLADPGIKTGPPAFQADSCIAGRFFTHLSMWYYLLLLPCWGLSGSQKVKNPLAMRETGLDPRVGKIPWRRACNAHLYSCLENPHEQRSLAGYSLWGHKE